MLYCVLRELITSHLTSLPEPLRGRRDKIRALPSLSRRVAIANINLAHFFSYIVVVTPFPFQHVIPKPIPQRPAVLVRVVHVSLQVRKPRVQCFFRD